MASSSNVPEEVRSKARKQDISRMPPPSPYMIPSAATSTNTFTMPSNGGGGGSVRSSKKTPSIRTLGKSSNDQLNASGSGSSSSMKRTTSTSSTANPQQQPSASSSSSNGHKQMKSSSGVPQAAAGASGATQRYRANPRLPHDKDAEPSPSTVMYWSRAPVWGALPMRTMRGHSVTLVDSTAWLIGGCDNKDSSKELYCFNTGTQKPIPYAGHLWFNFF